MGGKVSRVCKIPLQKFTQVQKLNGGSTAKVNHIKGKEFEQLVPTQGFDDAGHSSASSSHAEPLKGSSMSTSGAESGGDSVEDFPGPSTPIGSEQPSTSQPVHIDKPTRGRSGQGSLHKAKSKGSLEDEDPEAHPHQYRTVKGDGETKRVRNSGRESQIGGGARLSTSSNRQSTSKVGCSSSEKNTGKDGGLRASGANNGAIGRPFPKRPIGCKLSSKTWAKLEELFRLMDEDGSNAVTREEAKAFFQGAFSNLSVDAMFNEVDTDGSGAITSEEFVKFWVQVRSSGYKEQDICDELDELIEGGAWVDWKDGRDTVAHEIKFPKRPMLCRLSAKAWEKCEELFHKMSGNDEKMQITRDKAQHFFKGAFCNISADAMFNEIDVNHHGVITPKEFMKFWTQLRSHGYKERDILEEIDNLMEGSPWVDWKDGRRT